MGAALAALAALVVAAGPPGSPVGPASFQSNGDVERGLAGLPLAFERNEGQGGPGVDFLARSTDGTFLLGPAGAKVHLAGAGGDEAALGIGLPGSSPAAPRALEALPGRVNYLVGDDPSRRRTEVPTFARVAYPGVWPGVDLEWYGDGRRLEYDFRLAPGADPSAIRMRMRGAERLRLAANGDLLISASGGRIRQRAPRAYQRIDGARRSVPASFSVNGKTVGFSVGRHDPSRPLVIDPIVLLYSTYLGGSGADGEFGPAGDVATAVDGAGAAYVVGSTNSTDFNEKNSIEGHNPGDSSEDVVISKLDPSRSGASSLVYSTYLGGDGFDVGAGIAVDAAGAAYVTGSTDSDDFNTVNPIEGHTGIAQDVFVAKLTPAGNALAYSTYLGGTTNDHGRGIAVDSSGAAYVVGTTTSNDFDTTDGAFEEDVPGGNDAFAFKLNSTGTALVYSSYLGGSSQEQGNGVAVDSSGSAYVTGLTESTEAGTPFPTQNAYEGDPGDGALDAFVTKLSPAGSSLAFSTYLGGNAQDIGQAIAVDGSAAAYVTGQTSSTDFDTTTGALEESDLGDSDAFVTKFTTQGSTLAYSTYLGGGDADEGAAIAVGSTGAAHVAGTTTSADFPPADPIDNTLGGEDAFVSRLNAQGSALGFSTRLGGADSDQGQGIAVSPSGRMVLAGTTRSTDFDTVKGLEDDSADADMFVSRLGEPVSGGPGAGGGGPPGGGPPSPEPPAGEPCKRKEATIVGTDGKDKLTGTNAADVIAGLRGKDRIRGLGGKDLICGGKGKDKIKGGKKKDKLFGEGGKDKLSGGKGNDKLKGAKGNDRLNGGPGRRDRCSGGKGKRDRATRSCERVRGVP